MPSPLAHIGLSLALGKGLRPEAWAWKDLGLLAFSAIAADLDVAPMLWDPNGIRWHHGPTHSLCGAAMTGLVISAFSCQRLPVFLAALLHVPLDWSTGDPGVASRYGVPLFWPFSDQKYIAAWPWFGAFGIDSPSGLQSMIGAESLAIYGRELLTVAVAGLGLRAWRR